MSNFLEDLALSDDDLRVARERRELNKARMAFLAKGDATGGIAWPEIEPLPDSLRPVEPFNMALLPESLRPWAQDIANRVQCPPDFIGATIIGALGIAIGRRVGVRPKLRDDWTEYANQWVCIVGRPGVMKSPAMSAVLSPVKRLDMEAGQHFEDDLAEHENDIKLYKMRQDAVEKKVMATLKKSPDAVVDLRSSDAPEPPKLTRYLVNDATVEKLGEICADNPQGVGVFRDELVSLLKGLDRDGQESARGFYLTGWNGNDGYVVDRIMRGHQRIEAVCLSLIGSTQPGRLSEYLRSAIGGGAADDGLVQRFGVLVWPDVPRATWENVDCWPDAEAKHAAHAVFKRLINADPVETWQAEMPAGPDGEPDDNPPFLRLSPEGMEIFVEWRTEHENALRSGDLHPAMESHLAKYRKLVPSLALVLHLANGGIGPVTDYAMNQALAWAAYLRSHAERAYGSVLVAEVSGAKALLRRIKAGDLTDGFTARDVYRNQWSGLENREAATKAIGVLIEYGYLVPEAAETGGRAKSVYRIHPGARK
ncbi:YfjI family protein [Paraburkholderia tropica]|uniref:YfjI family protein n=1 Tax=Paraburkholderia tropica TaxID=92647 RepID=UPI002AB17339|nr:YfjI family protein [Paraburkholderia tropica]